MTIVAIGGGELGEGETLPIDQFIVSHTRKHQPRALFVPTASGDAPGYIETFERVYGQELGCEIRALTLFDEPGDQDVAEAIDWADLIYVGGGNTRKLMQKWRERGLDRLLTKAWHQGKMLCGLSAGAICWFEAGLCDSERFETEESRGLTRMDALGLVPGLFCPHLDSKSRTLPLLENIARQPIAALAATDCAAVVVNEGQVSVLCGREDAGVYQVLPQAGGLHWSCLT